MQIKLKTAATKIRVVFIIATKELCTSISVVLKTVQQMFSAFTASVYILISIRARGKAFNE